MTNKRESVLTSDLPPLPDNTLKENVIRINNLFFKRVSTRKQSETNTENEKENKLIRTRVMRNSALLPSRSESPGNAPMSSREPNSGGITSFSRIKKSENNSHIERSKSVLKARSNTIANIKVVSDSVRSTQSDLKRQQSCINRIVKDAKEVPLKKQIPISLTDNLLDKIRQKVITEQTERGSQSERTSGRGSIRSIDITNKRNSIRNNNTNTSIITERKSINQSLERSISSQMNSQLISLIRATKVDLKEDRKEIQQMMDDHMNDMDQISRKHFKPSFKTRWALAILGRPPEVQFTKLYTCSKPGFKFYKRRFMNSNQEV